MAESFERGLDCSSRGVDFAVRLPVRAAKLGPHAAMAVAGPAMSPLPILLPLAGKWALERRLNGPTRCEAKSYGAHSWDALILDVVGSTRHEASSKMVGSALQAWQGVIAGALQRPSEATKLA